MAPFKGTVCNVAFGVAIAVWLMLLLTVACQEPLAATTQG